MWGKKKKNLTRKSSDGVTTTKSGVVVAQFAQKSFWSRLKDRAVSLPGRIWRLPKWSRLAVLIGLTAGLVGLGWLVWNGVKGPDNTSAVCRDTGDDSLLNRARQAMDPNAPNRIERLKTVVEEIQKLPNYEIDGNCLFPIVSYYIAIGNTDRARESYEKLKGVHNGKDFQSAYTQRITLESLKDSVEHLEKAGENIQNSTLFFGAPISGGEE